jgi:hypothetical protein
VSEALTELPAGHPLSGYVSPDLSFEDAVGDLPPEEEAWNEERDTAQEADTENVLEAENQAATEIREERLDTSGLRLTALVPDWCSISGQELVLLHVYGSGFTVTSEIWWHDHLEPTEFVSEGELTTYVTPWVFNNPDEILVGVQDAGVDSDQQLYFRLLP